MVAGDDGAHFVAGDTILSFRLSLDNKPRSAFALSREHVGGAQHVDDVPRFSRANQCRRALLVKIDAKKSGAPELAFVCVTALLLGAIDDLMNLCWRDGKSGTATADSHPKRR